MMYWFMPTYRQSVLRNTNKIIKQQQKTVDGGRGDVMILEWKTNFFIAYLFSLVGIPEKASKKNVLGISC